MQKMALSVFRAVSGFMLAALFVPALQGQAAEAGTSVQRDGRRAVTAPQAGAVSPAEPQSPTHPLSLDEALSRTLAQSPDLAASTREVEAREAEALQAGLLPNPEIAVEMENVAGTGEHEGSDNAETTLRISQLVGLGGKRVLRREAARQDRKVAEREFDLAKAEAMARTTERFIATLAAQERLSLTGEQAVLAGQVLHTVEEAVEAGKSAVVEQVRFSALLSEARLEQEKAQQELVAARKILAASWGGKESDFGEVQGDLEDLPPLPVWSDLDSRVGESPEAARRAGVLEAAHRILDLERARRFPDLTVSLGLRRFRETDDNAVVGEISLPIPVFDRNQGGAGAAHARLFKAQEEERSAGLRLQADLSEAWRRMQSSRSEIEVLKNEILPAAEQGFEAVRYGYRAGKFGFLEVLDGQRTLFDARSRYLDALIAYHRAAVEVDRLLGRKIQKPFPPTVGDREVRGSL